MTSDLPLQLSMHNEKINLTTLASLKSLHDKMTNKKGNDFTSMKKDKNYAYTRYHIRGKPRCR